MAKTVKVPQTMQPLELKGKISGKNITFDKKTFDGFVNLVAKLGLGASNQFSFGHYKFGPLLSRNRMELEAAYRAEWIVQQVVNTKAEDMTKEGVEITSEHTPEELSKITEAIARLKIMKSLCSALKWSRLYGGSVAVMLIDGHDFKTPLNVKSIKEGQFRGLLVLDRWLVQPTFSELITEYGPDLGMPKYYDIIGDAQSLPNIRIHHTRCLRFDGVELPYYQKKAENGWGMSVLEPMHSVVLMFNSVVMGAAQLVFKAHLRGVGVQGLREALSIGGKVEEAIIKQFEYIRLMQTNEGLTLLDSQDQFWTQQFTFSGIPDMIIQAGQQVSGACGIPLVRLFGQSPTGLNSTGESDLRTYYDNINKDQENELRPQLAEKLFPVLCMSALGKEMPDDFDFIFPSLWQMDDKEKVDISKSVADSLGVVHNMGVVSDKTILKELKSTSKMTGIWTNITDEMINKADDEVHPQGEFGFGMPGFEPLDDNKKVPADNQEDKAT